MVVFVHDIIVMMIIIISPFGQLGLQAPSSGVQDVFTLIAYDTGRMSACIQSSRKSR
jgi:hypothetical protein